jgi:hypothetical protein
LIEIHTGINGLVDGVDVEGRDLAGSAEEDGLV